MLKTKQEIEVLREGGKRLADVIARLAADVVEGITTQELEDKARKYIVDVGGKPAFLGYKPDGAPWAYPAALCTSINDVIVHGIPNGNSAQTLKSGDIITLDAGLEYDGLITDHATTVAVGEVNGKVKNLLAVTRQALKQAIATAEIGNTIGDISAAVQVLGDAHGFGIPYELGGHGVGHGVHEDPFVSNVGDKGTGEKLREGMVLALEPMFTLGTSRIELDDDGYSIRTTDKSLTALEEHTVAITKDGPLILTQL